MDIIYRLVPIVPILNSSYSCSPFIFFFLFPTFSFINAYMYVYNVSVLQNMLWYLKISFTSHLKTDESEINIRLLACFSICYVPLLQYVWCQLLNKYCLNKLISQGCYLVKIDLSSAYRSVPTHPTNYQATGLKWQFANASSPTYMYDTKLLFGSAKIPHIFQRLSSAVCRILKNAYN